jgi:hypothetical protein
VSVFSVVLGAVIVTVGVVLMVRSLHRLSLRSGETRAKVIISQRRGGWFRSWLLLAALGLLVLAGGVTPGSGWWWSALTVYAALLVWDVVVWLKVRHRRAHT